jgi:hypothetical protein
MHGVLVQDPSYGFFLYINLSENGLFSPTPRPSGGSSAAGQSSG